MDRVPTTCGSGNAMYLFLPGGNCRRRPGAAVEGRILPLEVGWGRVSVTGAGEGGISLWLSVTDLLLQDVNNSVLSPCVCVHVCAYMCV